LKLRAWLVCGLVFFASQANAGLLSDDEARKHIDAIEVRVVKLEESAAKLQESINQNAEATKQQTKSILDLQQQIEAINVELRKLRGQYEEFVHLLQDSEKRQKDFYVDLDTRLRRFEVDAAQQPVATESGPAPASAPLMMIDDPVLENRAYEAAFGLYKAKSYPAAITSFQDFQRKFPNSVQLPNVYYLMGESFMNLKDYPSASTAMQTLVEVAPKHAKASEALLTAAKAQEAMEQPLAAKKLLRKLIAQYPDSDAAVKAKERLAVLK
jgi:tol-pal system protein YbgF